MTDGIGSSTPHRYGTVLAFADDMRTIADTLGIDKMAIIGLSGGGPYTLACAAAMPDRVVAVGVLGGVAPTSGPDAVGGGVMALGSLNDHIVPFAHGQHVVSRLPDATLFTMPGESHMDGLALAEDIPRTILDIWDRNGQN